MATVYEPLSPQREMNATEEVANLNGYVPQTKAPPPNAYAEPNYLTDGFSWTSWLFTVDHKRIGILYLITTGIAFFLGAVAAALVRTNLIVPGGALFGEDTYNKVFSAHGIIMTFLVLVPIVPGVFGNFFIPIMIGAKDMAFPRLNLASWYLYMIGFGLIMWGIFSGGVDTGWTLYPPYSTESASNVMAIGLGIFVSGFSSIATALNVMVTTHKMRAPGMTWYRLPLFVWSMYATSLIMLLATPVLGVTVILLAIERLAGVGIFNPNLGGDPILFQHMFWFYSHPAVYIMILPGMGVISEVLTCFARKNIFGYKAVAYSSLGIAVVGFFVWGHHMFVSSQGYFLGMIFSFLTMLVAVPSAIKVFNWTATLYRGSISLKAPMLFALGFIALFTVGGVTGLYLGVLGTDIHLHDTYFVVAHFHFTMVGGMLLAFLAGLHYWWPKMTGKMYSDWWSRIAAVVICIGFFLTFLPQFVMGTHGLPRRYPNYPEEFQILHVMSTAGSSILGVGYAMPVFYLLHSLFFGRSAGPNPWRATGLEWQIPSPPEKHNFDHTPVVTEGPYEYAMSPGSVVDPVRGERTNVH